MNNLLDEFKIDFSQEDLQLSLSNIVYETSFFVKVSSNNKQWFIKNINMTESDQINILENLISQQKTYVEEFRTDERDPEFIYKFNNIGLLLETKEICEKLIDGEAKNINQTEDDQSPSADILITNYEGNDYPLNDEINLIIHRINLNSKNILVFCQQTYTSLSKTSLRTILNNELVEVNKEKFYKINNNISFILSINTYFIMNMNYFEKIFSFENQTKLQKEKALQALEGSGSIEGYAELLSELQKGYMSRSVAKIALTKDEIPAFLKEKKAIINRYCKDYNVGVNFDTKKLKLNVIEPKTASLFVTHLFSTRVAENIMGELVTYKNFNKLNKK